MRTSTLRRMSRPAATSTSTATKSAATESAAAIAGPRQDQADEHGERAGQVAREMERVRCERGAAVAAAPPRSETAARLASIARTTPMTRNVHHAASISGARRRRGARSRRQTITRLASGEDRGLGERAEVLGLPVSVGVASVGRPAPRRRRRRRSRARRRDRCRSEWPRRSGRGCPTPCPRRA